MEAMTLHSPTATLLVVDDEPLMTDLFSQYMSRLGYRILVACNGEQALEIIASELTPIQIVVSDMNMPGMDGLTLAKRLFKIAPSLSVILTTGIDCKSETESLPPNIVCFLQKPYQNRLLAEKIAGILANSASSPDLA